MLLLASEDGLPGAKHGERSDQIDEQAQGLVGERRRHILTRAYSLELFLGANRFCNYRAAGRLDGPPENDSSGLETPTNHGPIKATQTNPGCTEVWKLSAGMKQSSQVGRRCCCLCWLYVAPCFFRLVGCFMLQNIHGWSCRSASSETKVSPSWQKNH